MSKVVFDLSYLERIEKEREERDATPEGQARLEKERLAKEESARIAREYRRRDNMNAAKDLRVSDRVRHCLITGSGLTETPALAALRKWGQTQESLPWLVLSGTTGVGKSVAAAWAVACEGGVWVRAEKLVRIFCANFGDQYEQQDEIRDCTLLVLDDIGSELDQARMSSTLIEILDARKSWRHRTIVTTNLSKPDFRKRYSDPRLLSRMAEQAEFASDNGPDMRRNK